MRCLPGSVAGSLGILIAIGAARAAPVPVPNGDFEQGLDSWTLIRPDGYAHGELTLVTDDVHGGRQAARILNPDGEKVLCGLYSAQPIRLPDDSRAFQMSAWLKADAAPEMIEFRVASCDRDGRILTPHQEKGWRFARPPLGPLLGQWYRYVFDFAAQDEWGGFYLTVWVRGSGAVVRIDDLTLDTIDPLELAVASTGARLADPAEGVALWWEGPLRRIYPFEAPPGRRDQRPELIAAGGETEVFQVALRAERPLAGLRARIDLPGIEAQSRWVGLVPVSKTLTARTVLGPTPDPLLATDTIDLSPGETRSLWVTLRVPRGAPAGRVEGRVRLEAEGLSATVPVVLETAGFDLPERPTLRTIARIWQTHPGAEALFRQNVAAHRCAGHGYLGGISLRRDGERLVVDTSQLSDAIDRNLRAYGFTVFNVPHIFLGDWSGLYNKEGLWQGYRVFEPDFDEAFEGYCRQVADALRAAGVLPYAIWQIWDEPHDELLAHCVHLARLVKRAAPDARIYLTSRVQDELLDLVDIWNFPWPAEPSESEARARARGAEIWAYQNDLYSLDRLDSSLRLRSYGWRLRARDIAGVEWWAISSWKSDPWTTPNQYPPQNGGGFFLYPTPDRQGAPIDSIRWETYRETVEDYDLLTMLSAEQDRVRAALGLTDPAGSGASQRSELAARVADAAERLLTEPTRLDETHREVLQRIALLCAEPPTLVTTRQDGDARWVEIVAGAPLIINGEAQDARAWKGPIPPTGLSVQVGKRTLMLRP